MSRLFAVALLTVCAIGFVPAAEPGDDDTPQAAATRKKLQTKVTVKFKEEPLKECIDELKEMAGVSILYDAKGGVSGNQTINYEGKDAINATVKSGNGLGDVLAPTWSLVAGHKLHEVSYCQSPRKLLRLKLKARGLHSQRRLYKSQDCHRSKSAWLARRPW